MFITAASMTRSLLIFTCLCVSFTKEVTGLDCVQPPLECPNVNVTFFLITRSNVGNPHQLLVSDPNSLSSAPFVEHAPFKVIIHGYKEDNTTTPSLELIPAYLDCCDYNLINVNFGPLAKEPCYIQAAANTELAGKCTAQLLDVLVRDYGIPLSLFHFIGFSLGAHVAGFTANYQTSGQLERITALDAASPLFVSLDNNRKIDPSDAKMVDALHTNAAQLGKLETVGKVDFYANGGFEQPGCLKFDQTLFGCSHLRAPAYFAESISTTIGFYAYRCPSLLTLPLCKPNTANQLLFGEYVPLDASGLYFFNTNSASPYAQGPLTN